MKIEKFNTIFFTLSFGIVAVLLIFTEIIYKRIGIVSAFVYIVLFLGFIVTLIYSIRLKMKRIIFLNIMLIVFLIIGPAIPRITFFQPKTVLEASLQQERSGWCIVLFENNKFLVRSSNLGGFEDFEGYYSILNNKIIFHSKTCDNLFIPDTIRIWKNYLILDNKSSIPDTTYSRFGISSHFKIYKNELNLMNVNNKSTVPDIKYYHFDE